MKRLKDLIGLEKSSAVEIRYCEIVSDYSDENKNIRYRILKSGERYFYHKMRDGEVVECFEVALSWKPTGDILIFAYTPDDRHVYEIDSRNPSFRDVFKLEKEQIHGGDSCEFRGHKLEYADENKLILDGVSLFVEFCGEYVYNLMKRKIKAIDGARGLYIFLENIAEEGKANKYPLFADVWNMIADKYLPS